MNRFLQTTLAVLALSACREIHAPRHLSLHRLEIQSLNRSIALHEQVSLQLFAYDYYGVPLTVPLLSWSSGDASVASVDSSGVVTGRSLGYALIKAVGGGKTDNMWVRIEPASFRITMVPETLTVGDTGIISAVHLDHFGVVIPGEFGEPFWVWQESNVADLLRLPRLAASQLAVIGKTPGRLFLWAESAGMSGDRWITVVASNELVR